MRGIGVYTDREAADEVNSDPEFASYNDRIEPLLASPPERVELQLLHHHSLKRSRLRVGGGGKKKKKKKKKKVEKAI